MSRYHAGGGCSYASGYFEVWPEPTIELSPTCDYCGRVFAPHARSCDEGCGAPRGLRKIAPQSEWRTTPDLIEITSFSDRKRRFVNATTGEIVE